MSSPLKLIDLFLRDSKICRSCIIDWFIVWIMHLVYFVSGKKVNMDWLTRKDLDLIWFFFFLVYNCVDGERLVNL